MSGRFEQRSSETELMDTETVSLDDYEKCLRDLSVVNVLTLTHAPILNWLGRALRRTAADVPITILDVGFGYGDLLRRISVWSRARGLRADLVGIDLNPFSETIARAATPADAAITYTTGNVFQTALDRPFDFIISSQTAHHFSNDELVTFVSWMERTARRGWFIADLHRHAVPFHVFRAISRVAGWHRFVQHDGPVSIARSFRRADWTEIIRRAGVDPADVEIRWHIPFRLCVSRLK